MMRGGSLERLRWSLQGDPQPSLAATDGVRRWLRCGGPKWSERPVTLRVLAVRKHLPKQAPHF